MSTIGPSPLVPAYLKDYLARYYDNMSSTTIFDEVYVRKSYYFAVNLTPIQLQSVYTTIQNKDVPPFENLIGTLLHVSELSIDGVVSKKYYIVQFVLGTTEFGRINAPNVVTQDYLLATYLNLTGVDFNPEDFVNDPRPIVLPPEAVIDTNPENISICEKNQGFANSLNWSKTRVSDGNFPSFYPPGGQPVAFTYYREPNSDLTTYGGVGLYNVSIYEIVFNNNGLSKSVKNFIECLP